MSYTSEFASLIDSTFNAIGKPIAGQDYEIEDRGKPHVPPTKMPPEKMAVYTFIYNGQFLKIGKANQKSEARFTYQHYNPNSARSTLAKSILNDTKLTDARLDDNNIGEWIKNNCLRVDIIINERLGVFTLNLIESILHYRYEPKYEGFISQR